MSVTISLKSAAASTEECVQNVYIANQYQTREPKPPFMEAEFFEFTNSIVTWLI